MSDNLAVDAFETKAPYARIDALTTNDRADLQDSTSVTHSAEFAVCFHCLEPVPEYCNLSIQLDGERQALCCLGCKAAAEFIIDRGLTRFYEHRARLDQTDFFGDVATHAIVLNDNVECQNKWGYLDSPKTSSPYVAIDSEGRRFITLIVDGIYCSSCTWLIERALVTVSEEVEFQADIDARRVSISIADTTTLMSQVLSAIESLGYSVTVCEIGDRSNSDILAKRQKNAALIRIIVAGFGMMQVMTYATAGYFGSAAEVNSVNAMEPEFERFFLLISMLVSTIVVFYSGKPFFVNAIGDIRNGHLGMDVPIALAISGAYFPSVYQVFNNSTSLVYFDSAVMFVFFLSLGRYVEMRARHKLSGASADLHQVLPNKIEVYRPAAEQTLRLVIKPSEVITGDQVMLNCAQIVPFDAIIIDGKAQLDESLVTGEVVPISKQIGKKLLAGTRVLSGHIVAESTGDWAASSISKIQNSLQKAQRVSQQETNRSRLLSRFFIMAILVLTTLVASAWMFIQPDRVFEVSLAMLIASCPCAFSLAAPVSRSAAIHYLRSVGVLLTNSTALSMLTKATAWCFDKTGTLTQGEPSIKQVHCLSTRSTQQCLEIVATLEKESEHILARAFNNIESNLLASEVSEEIGQGIQANIDGVCYRAGKRSWILDVLPNAAQQLREVADNGIEVVLCNSSDVLAVIELQDELRPSSFSFVSKIINNGARISVLSGDNKTAVSKACDRLAIKHQHAELLPIEKVQAIQALQSDQHVVAMVGDGINDAPVLAQADISIAMASGSNLALSNADVVLLNGDLSKLELLVRTAQCMDRITSQNVSWALAYNLIALSLAASGLLTPWIAALGMSISSLVVVLNALRIGANKCQ